MVPEAPPDLNLDPVIQAVARDPDLVDIWAVVFYPCVCHPCGVRDDRYF